MKLKYYLRGLGIGILLSTLIVSLANKKTVKIELTDDEIIERAEALGMKMSNVTIDWDAVNDSIKEGNSDHTEEEKENQVDLENEESKKDAGHNEESKNEIPETDAKTQEEETQVSDNLSSDSTEKENQGDISSIDENVIADSKDSQNENADQEEVSSVTSDEDDKKTSEDSKQERIVAITIKAGMTAYQVSKMLEDAGVIENAYDFDNYLIENDKAEQILSQKVEIKIGSDYETIAKLITNYN